jgi:1,2-diacylglycerol-3-alpha-glucose alpha-1,2-glucosyltransferase
MKVCLYGELSGMLKGSGIGTAIDQQEKALRLNGVEVTRDPKGSFDLIDINTIGPKSAYIAHKMRWKGVPVVIHSHTTVEDLKDSFMFTTKLAPRLKGYLRYFYSQADLIVSPTEYTKDVLRGYGLKRSIVVVSNGVDTEKFRFSDTLRRQCRGDYDLSGVVPYSVGHIFKRKGVVDFLDIAQRFPQNRFLWAGRDYKGLVDGRIKDRMKNKPDNVTFTGYVKDIVGVYCSGDIFLFPSYCENQGISILEAASCKRPLIVRDLPAYDDWLIDPDNCLKANNNEEFTRHVKTLIEDANLRRKLGQKAYRMSRRQSLRIVGGRLKSAYETLLKK